ncbi:MAG: HIT domain-containing protein [Candidatus Aureabacteria bacterium]|nr:HIT domain-containing protein [Candidatus Auribacterota bacterium]
MDNLWAPWRMKYIENILTDRKGKCIFCAKPEENNDKANMIITRGKKCFVIMNLYPYNNGHLMIAPYAHVPNLTSLDNETILEILKMLQKCEQALRSSFHPDGFNVGVNIGRAAGAGIDQHIHFHVVPRWNGDTNFMPVLDNTKVIVQSLEDTYNTLKPLFEKQTKSLGQLEGNE